jgi:hypothetical protein
MLVTSLLRGVTEIVRFTPKVARYCILAACLSGGSSSWGDEIAFDDFEGLTLVPFTVATGVGDGTDWSQTIPTWTIDNSLLDPSNAEAYNGWSAMDVNSWIEEQGVQDGRDRMKLGAENNTALVADPDAWDDFYAGSGDNYTSYISKDYDISTAALADLIIAFDWDFVCEDNQRGVVDVSFDGGVTWQNLIDVQSTGTGGFANGTVFSTNPMDYTVEPTPGEFSSGVDFTVPDGATTLTLRFGVIEAGNDWWFAVDNVEVMDGAGYSEFDNFEGLELLSFPSGGVGLPPGDDTDWSDSIPGWVIDNTGMLQASEEEAFNGWRAIDAQSWVNEQGGQQRSFLNEESIFGARNTVMVADSDAHEDYVADDPDPAEQDFNSYVYREYDLSIYDNTSVVVEFDWECRVESPAVAIVEASFDGGTNWVEMLKLDGADPTTTDALSDYLYLGTDHYATFNAPQTFTFGDAGSALPARHGGSMILRFGYLNSENNWWFAFDAVKVDATPQGFMHGDANQDGSISFGDIGAFVMALQSKASYDATYTLPADIILDMDASGVFNFGDIGGFIAELQ